MEEYLLQDYILYRDLRKIGYWKRVNSAPYSSSQFPERMLISYMVAKDQDRWVEFMAEEFENVS